VVIDRREAVAEATRKRKRQGLLFQQRGSINLAKSPDFRSRWALEKYLSPFSDHGRQINHR
jgi:hypothetical protein